jgi:hypothetical protein
MDYSEFLQQKLHQFDNCGFSPLFIPGCLFDFQKALLEWGILKGRFAIYSDCGTGKTLMQLVWAENLLRKTNKPALIITPLAVTFQTCEEGKKFDIECKRSIDGKAHNCTTVTNYEQLHKFNPNDFSGVACDESSILKNYQGAYKNEITDFMRKISYRSLWTATAAPNDFIELGTSSEALGYMGHIDMLTKYFKNDNNNVSLTRHFGEAPKWRIKRHAEIPFWRYITSWARALRKPSDLEFNDDGFALPELIENEHLIEANTPPDGMFLNLPAKNLPEQRAEKRRTIQERCEKVAELMTKDNDFSIAWCQLNDEGDLLEKLIPGSVQISGSDLDEKKEEKFYSFIKGDVKKLITKPKIGAWGLNFQHCNHQVYFPSHSFEQKYQLVRRCWRFGQKRPVTIDTVFTEGERKIINNLKRKEAQATQMFDALVREMNNSISYKKLTETKKEIEVPLWL